MSAIELTPSSSYKHTHTYTRFETWTIKQSTQQTVLRQVFGVIRPFNVTGLMGPSGAGERGKM